jgi:16S rRNA (adenine1518-N6/adenine1519-N6)-dimethyltransferase
MENPYLHPSRVRAALRSLELRPTRGMGQNFLIDDTALQAIVAAADLQKTDTVLEIGPGLGVLTWELVQRAGRVVAVELDKRLAARLREEFAQQPNLTIVQSDILNVAPGEVLATSDERRTTNNERLRKNQETRKSEYEEAISNLQSPIPNPRSPISNLQSPIPRPPPYKVVANLPYAITSAVLRHLLEAVHKPELIVVLVQWEVAQRIVAQPGDLSVLAHSVQIYAEPKVVARVRADNFLPAPDVDSAILRLRVRPRPAVDVDNIDSLMRVIKAGFLQARKKLSNALPSGLASMGIRIDKERVIAALQGAGVDPNRRAETVTLGEWAGVYRGLGVKG